MLGLLSGMDVTGIHCPWLLRVVCHRTKQFCFLSERAAMLALVAEHERCGMEVRRYGPTKGGHFDQRKSGGKILIAWMLGDLVLPHFAVERGRLEPQGGSGAGGAVDFAM